MSLPPRGPSPKSRPEAVGPQRRLPAVQVEMAGGPSRANLQEEEEDLLRALSVLAGSDPERCSYPGGYVKRQAVFSCSTCNPDPLQPAGVCLACANNCHDGHQVFELYTKRDFRCDCGNGRFGGFRCKLVPEKEKENKKNRYNHNFHDRYCTCDRPYPDTEDQVNDEMIQCVICEDWFHTRHLGCTPAEPEELQEMVCQGCMDKAPFLWTYAAHFAVAPEEEEEEEEAAAEEHQGDSELKETREETQPGGDDCRNQGAEADGGSSCKRTHQEMVCSSAAPVAKPAVCKLKELQAQRRERRRQGAVFWPYSWRSELCTCTSCKRAYVAAQVQFLMDQSDSVLAYEKRGLEAPLKQHPLTALTSSMDRQQQLEFIYGFNELARGITSFLQQCAEEGKVVTPEAVYQFFEELKARKRSRMDALYQ